MAQYESAEALYGVIDTMVATLQESDAFKQRIQYAKRTVGFRTTSPTAAFKLSFREGDVSWEQASTDGCQIVVHLTGDMLHELFTGARNAESAYMTGNIRLEGDEYTAQGMLYYMGDLVKAYKKATEAA